MIIQEKNLKSTKYNFIVVCILTILLSIPSITFSEEADRDKAIEIESDTMTVDDAKSISIYLSLIHI